MGRAIDMVKDIDMLKIEVKWLENIIRGMSSSINEMEDKSTKTTHIDLVDDVKEEDNDGEEKTNDEGSGKSSGSDNKSSGNTKRKTKQARSNSKWIYSL